MTNDRHFKTPKRKVLIALYDGSKVQGMGIFQAKSGSLSEAEAKSLLEEQTYFDYLHGKVMKVDLSGNELDPRLYDRDNGQGKAAQLIKAIK